MLEAAGIFYHIDQKSILDNISVTLKTGRLHVILGPNGSGKSTLLKILSGELHPSSGSVLYDGENANAITRTALARRRAVMTQSPELQFPLSVKEVVMMGRYPHFQYSPSAKDNAICTGLMRQLNLAEFAERDYLTLSGGEKQRVHFARAQAQIAEAPVKGCRYLLLDEPISNADIHYQHQFMQQLRKLVQEGVSVIAVLHDINLALQYADRFLFLNHGRLLKEGERDIVTPSLMSEVFSVQINVLQPPDGAPPVIVYKTHS